MTPATDDDALEAAFEALLAGRRVPPAAEGLVAFADGVRATAARAPRPSAALADLLATGLLTDQSSAPAPRAVRSRRRSTRRMFLAFFAKFAAAGVAAKAATVAGVVVVGVSTAGFTNELPAPVQATWDHLTSQDQQPAPTATDGGTTGADSSGTTTTTGTSTAPEGTSTGTTETTGTTGTTTGGTAGTPTSGTTVAAPTTGGLGPVVSGKVEHGSVDGTRVSDLAHQRNANRKAAASSSAGTGTPTTTDDGSDDDTATSGGSSDDSAPAVTEDSGSKGSGSGHGGHGNG